MSHHIEIEPATHDQLRLAGDDWIDIRSDLGEIAKELQEIDDRLHLRYNRTQEFYAIYAKEKGNEYLVGTYKSLDRRVTTRIREIMSASYNYVKEIEEIDKNADKEFHWKMDQIHGENAEKLAHAIRKDLELNKDRIFVKHGYR